jgi:carboxyl-terminal processing protease
MKILIVSIALLVSTVCHPQKKYSPAEIQRLGDYGKLWGALHYFHPLMGSGNINTDSVALSGLNGLINDASAAGFKTAINKMLAIVNDANTRINNNNSLQQSLLFTTAFNKTAIHKLPDSTWYIASPTAAVAEDDVTEKLSILPLQWSNAKAVILDIRNATINNNADFNFLYNAIPYYEKYLMGKTTAPEIFERVIYHNGFVQQNNGAANNVYNSGWRTINKNNTAGAVYKKPAKPLAVVINSNTNYELIKVLQSFKLAGVCHLIFEGSMAAYPVGNIIPLQLADNTVVNIRVSDYLVSKQNFPLPDMQLTQITDTSLDGSFIQQCKNVLAGKSNNAGIAINAANTSMQYILPRPSNFSEDQLPNASKRLYALYNWWNAINYFSPYKKETGSNWDSVLHRYIPVLLQANDSLAYNMALRAMISEIHDCHGFFSNIHPLKPVRKALGYWPPLELYYVENKLMVIEVGKDSLQNMSDVKVWDEITHINGSTVKERERQWRKYFSTSNENTFRRDVVNYIINGPQNSTVNLQLLRNGKPITVKLQRTGRQFLTNKNIDFNNRYKAAEMLPDNIGYINMGKLQYNKVDSTLKAFKNTKAIIFDIRNYPQGTAWSIAPHLTATPKPAVMFDKPLVDYNYLLNGEDKSTQRSYFTVYPANKKPYTGKVIVLCNEQTQSQAEYTIMMFQGATNATVIGSQTAGADGNVTYVVLPGGYSAAFSGLGIYYPDGTPTQRVGIKINIQARPTIAGLKQQKDEVLQRAIDFVKNNR